MTQDADVSRPAGTAGGGTGSGTPMAAPVPVPTPAPAPSRGAASPLEQVLFEVKRTIVGQDVLLERMAIGLLAGGHLLVEGVPGLAKTLAVKSLASAVGGQFQRIQFTPDLLPADLVGTRVYRQHTGEFETTLGPVFTNLLLADEINRAPAKVQSALLEVMQERQVTIGRETYPVPDPFLVLATQNPIESEGTYPLPEAQVDRFMMKVLVHYPAPVEEHAIVDRALRPPLPTQRILTPEDLVRMRAQVQDVYVDPAIVDYAVRLVVATRSLSTVGLGNLDRYVTHGASPRASIALVLGARALAYLRGRDYAVPQDLYALVPDVLRHRLVLSYEALADDVAPDTVIAGVLRAVPMPEVPLRAR
ncbi:MULTISPECIES: MoxR family ATPase [unclassified Frankia]|uniref:AAA family ATPase n=2 Tax=unclassified Frankia TaxID=2632575 RepID=UPI000AA0A258